ncbi:MAG: hypothetical protein KJ058_00590 [Thermoanaerobaculia bacterium]|nr:hypothetical protein [Thermoanaerobaculia bacterium]
MTGQALTTTGGQLAAPTRGPGRPLGLRAEPTLRLALGYRDEAKRGAPVKTDYFLAKEGTDGAHHAAAEKFRQVFGEKPKSIEIRLPGELAQALDIRHKAWAGGGDEDGGVLRAIGRTNFAAAGTLGGPDVLTVWHPDGNVTELDITGTDDPAAQTLGVELYTTFRFHIPAVLGAAGYAEITSKGVKTTDNLYARLAELYGMLGSRVSFAVQPRLVLRKATGRPLVLDRKTGEVKRIKSSFYALDLYVPESLEEMLERLQERRELMYGGRAPAELMYGPAAADPAVNGAGRDTPDLDAQPEAETEVEPEVGVDAGEGPIEPDSYEEPDDPADDPEPEPDEQLREAQAAGLVELAGKHAGSTIAQAAQDDPGYITWLAKKANPTSQRGREIQAAARAYAAVYLTGAEQ